MTKPIEPKPCPFCGGEPTVVLYRFDGQYVECDSRDCLVSVYATAGTRDEAIAKWNKRSEPCAKD